MNGVSSSSATSFCLPWHLSADDNFVGVADEIGPRLAHAVSQIRQRTLWFFCRIDLRVEIVHSRNKPVAPSSRVPLNLVGGDSSFVDDLVHSRIHSRWPAAVVGTGMSFLDAVDRRP